MNSADRERRFGYISKLKSGYLVKYFEIFISNNDLYVAMEYFKNGNLSDFIKLCRKENKKIEEYVYFYFI
jgi:serine/threonine protein kinase